MPGIHVTPSAGSSPYRLAVVWLLIECFAVTHRGSHSGGFVLCGRLVEEALRAVAVTEVLLKLSYWLKISLFFSLRKIPAYYISLPRESNTRYGLAKYEK